MAVAVVAAAASVAVVAVFQGSRFPLRKSVSYAFVAIVAAVVALL